MIPNPRFTRGTGAKTREEAITKGLDLLNTSYIGHGSITPRGRFFSYGGTTFSAESWAKRVAPEEGKTPVVIDITLTAENFHVLKDRLWFVDGEVHQERYTRIETFETFQQRQGGVVINMSRLSHEDLTELRVQVGFLDAASNFEYRTYQQWTQVLGVRAKTREEFASDRGINQFWKK